jgi:hypothetical protein
MPKRIFMETTSISASKTVSEITTKLVEAGARQISHSYSPEGDVSGVCFSVPVGGHLVSYALPANIDPIESALRKKRVSVRDRQAIRQQAVRVAWRQILRWVEAQLALIQTGMVTVDQVFLPYAQAPNGQTFYEAFLESGIKMLSAAENNAQR